MRAVFVLSCLLLSFSGCGNGTPRFAHRAEYSQLEPFAQKYVTETLDQYFGTPTESVAWERLPLNYHAAVGVVGANSSDRKVQLSIDDFQFPVGPGTEIYLEGTKQNAWISKWDEQTRIATLEGKLRTAPTAGESVLVGPGQMLRDGRHLYAQHCQHCHGVSGDGQGPTAPYLNPKPRDYRNGKFKFTSTTYDFGPNRGDLDRIILEGIPGTYMPSFKLLKPAELNAIREYVLWLSMRGEIEMKLISEGLADYTREAVKQRIQAGEKYAAIAEEFAKRHADGDFEETFNTVVDLVVDRWEGSQAAENLVQVAVNRPPATTESIARGRALYLHPDNKCASCHGDAGYGNGPQTYTLTPGKPGVGLYDDWNNPIQPRNLHAGVFRGGRRPYDLFCRIRASVKGTPMPKFDAMKEEDVWDLVNYIYSVPYETEVAGSGRVEQIAAQAAREGGSAPAVAVGN